MRVALVIGATIHLSRSREIKELVMRWLNLQLLTIITIAHLTIRVGAFVIKTQPLCRVKVKIFVTRSLVNAAEDFVCTSTGPPQTMEGQDSSTV